MSMILQLAPSTDAVSVWDLPLTFRAFYALKNPGYLAYATLHLDPDTAEHAVAQSFGRLGTRWHALVAEPNPEACAWRAHAAHVALRARRRRPPTLKDDCVTLHDDLRLSIDGIAALTGQDLGTVASLLAAAHREGMRRSLREVCAR